MAHSIRKRLLHGVRRYEPVCQLTELHQVAARVPYIKFVHTPRRFDDFAHIDSPGEICMQRMNVVHTDVAGGVLGDVLVRAKPEVNLDVLADGDAVVVVAKVCVPKPSLWKKSSEVAMSSEASTGMARSNMDGLSGIGHFPGFRRVERAHATSLRRCTPSLSYMVHGVMLAMRTNPARTARYAAFTGWIPFGAGTIIGVSSG